MILALVFAALLLGGVSVPNAVAADCGNRWVYLAAGPSTGVRAQLAIGAASASGGSQNVYVSLGGSQFLDIIQVGVRVRPDGSRRSFAAWGRGTPNAPGSLYEERDLGAVSRSWHTYELRLSAGVWTMRIDGVTRLRVSDSFRTWRIRSTKAAVEAEAPNARLGGTAGLPARARSARVLLGGLWRLPTWFEGGYCVPASTRDDFGRDWLNVWRNA